MLSPLVMCGKIMFRSGLLKRAAVKTLSYTFPLRQHSPFGSLYCHGALHSFFLQGVTVSKNRLCTGRSCWIDLRYAYYNGGRSSAIGSLRSVMLLDLHSRIIAF
jgi:hypothetical protein